MITSALNDGRPGAASAWTMCRRICVGAKNGCSCDSRESGWERSITRRAMSVLSGDVFTDLDDARHDRRDHALAELLAGARSVADNARGGDVAKHVHRHDHARPFRAHLVAAE